MSFSLFAIQSVSVFDCVPIFVINLDDVVLVCLRSTCLSGVLLFFIGMYINIYSDYTLRNLRKSRDKVETGYKIPRGLCTWSIIVSLVVFVQFKISYVFLEIPNECVKTVK